MTWKKVLHAAMLLGSMAMSAAEAQEAHGNSPLMIAAWHGDLPLVRQLLQQRADANQSNAVGLNALYFAAGATPTHALEHGVAGGTDVLQILLDQGVNPNARSSRNGMNALMAAADNARADRVALLLAHGADPNAQTTYGTAPLDFAIARRDVATIRVLLDASARVHVGPAPSLIAAAKAGDANIMQMLLRNRPDLNVTDSQGDTALTVGAMNNDTRVVELLLDAGANPDVRAKNLGGAAALMLAAKNGNVEMVDQLLRKHADVEVKDEAGRTAPDYARWYAHPAIWLALRKK